MTDLPQQYKDRIKEHCAKESIDDLESELSDIEQYFEEAKTRLWPNVKTDFDLQIECGNLPFIQRCIAYKKGELIL